MAAWLLEGAAECRTASDQATLAALLAEVEASGAWWVAALDYEVGYLFEPASAPPGWRPDPARPPARLWRFPSCRRLDGEAAGSWLAARLAELPADASRAGVGGVVTGCTEVAYRHAVARIRDYIAAGDCYQVNFTFPLDFEWFGHPLALYVALRERQPVRYGGFLGSGEGGVVSLSPELFLDRSRDRLRTRPMKGTAPRSADPDSLRSSAKDRAENVMIVDLLRNDLGRVAAGGSVRVDSLFEIEAFPTVWQMVSEVSAAVPGRGLGEILAALFPCGSIAGAPKIRAMQIASELEPMPRRLYTGALGWIAPDGDFRFNVAIRTLELGSDRRGRLGIGSGIVADSLAAAEWRECLLKSTFLTGLDPGLELIETLRREDGVYPHLELHLDRLRTSAAWLGFACDEAAVRAALAEQSGQGAWRVRLALDKAGRIAVAAQPLVPLPAVAHRAHLASARIDSRDPLRRHKTTARALYDAALRDIACDPQVFDQVFLNERGEVAEGARSNVFVERDGMLLTPPLASGALPGVLRADLLAQGRAREQVLRPVDLAEGFLLGNALRGLLPVRLQAA